MTNGKMTPLRAVLFFAPHIAFLVAIASAEIIGWDAMLHVCVAACIALPLWCRFVGRGWSHETRYMLGAGVTTLGFVLLFLYVLFTSEGPSDWTLAALILAVTAAFVPYSIFASFWRRSS